MLSQTNNGLKVENSVEINQFPLPEVAAGVDLFAQCKDAAELLLNDLVRWTPIYESKALSGHGRVFVKDETSQAGNSFKTRNAINSAKQYVRQGDSRFVTASAGSFGIGLAEALSHWGHDLEVVVPDCTNGAKIRAIQSLGAGVTIQGNTVDEALQYAKKRAKQVDARFVHPFANIHSISGASTIAWELLEDAPDATSIVLPFGGGSLASGVGTVIKALKPEIEVVVAQVERNSAFVDSVLSGDIKQSSSPDTRFGGIAVKATHPLTLGIGSRVVDRVLKLPAEYLYETLHILKPQTELGRVIEEAGACSPAGARFLAEQEAYSDQKIIAVATGANPGPVTKLYSQAVARRLQQPKERLTT